MNKRQSQTTARTQDAYEMDDVTVGEDALMTHADLYISPKTLQQQTVERLRAAIFEGFFKPGEKLVEAEVATLLGISRPSLREALRSLEGERLITIVPNRGPYVSVVTWSEAQEIYHVRKLLEGEAAALAAAHAAPKHIKAMRQALTNFEAAIPSSDQRKLLAATTAFYAALVKACGNQIIAEIQMRLLARISFLRNRSMSNPKRPKESLKEMTAIYDAIRHCDQTSAKNAAIRHVQLASEAAKSAFDEE